MTTKFIVQHGAKTDDSVAWHDDTTFITYEEAIKYASDEAKKYNDMQHRVVIPTLTAIATFEPLRDFL